MPIRARDIMSVDVQTIGPDDEIGGVLARLSYANFNGFPVVDDDDHVRGIVTQGDLIDLFQTSDRLRWIPIGLPPFIQPVDFAVDLSSVDIDLGIDLAKSTNEPISSVMTTDVVTVAPDDDLDRMLAILGGEDRDINRVPVVEDDRLVGIVTREDLLRTLNRERESTTAGE